jgi:hypothetical protein
VLSVHGGTRTRGPLRGPIGLFAVARAAAARTLSGPGRSRTSARRFEVRPRTQTGRDTPRRSRLPKPFLRDRCLLDLGPSRWVWWPQRGPVKLRRLRASLRQPTLSMISTSSSTR